MSAPRKNLGSFLIFLLGLVILLSPSAPRWMMQQSLSTNAGSRLDAALERNMKVFGTVSVLKGLLGVVEGSAAGASMGASLQVEIGDIIEAPYDYVNFVWELLLTSLFVISVYKLVLESGVLSLGIILLGGGLCLLSLVHFLRRRRVRSRTALFARQTFVAGVLFAYGLPLAIALSDGIAQRFTAPLERKAAAELSTIGKEFEITLKSFFSIREKFSPFHPGESLQAMIDAASALGMSTISLAERSIHAAFYFLAVQLFALLVLPVLLLATFYQQRPMLRRALR